MIEQSLILLQIIFIDIILAADNAIIIGLIAASFVPKNRKQIPCEIDSVCIHGDNESSLVTAKSIRDNFLDNGLNLISLNKMEKFT